MNEKERANLNEGINRLKGKDPYLAELCSLFTAYAEDNCENIGLLLMVVKDNGKQTQVVINAGGKVGHIAKGFEGLASKKNTGEAAEMFRSMMSNAVLKSALTDACDKND